MERFEELSLGPLLHHPLIEHYFSVPPDVTEIFKITTEEIICLLQTVMKKSKHILVEKFLECLEEKMLVSKEKLCVRIQNLGYVLHLMLLNVFSIFKWCETNDSWFVKLIKTIQW